MFVLTVSQRFDKVAMIDLHVGGPVFCDKYTMRILHDSARSEIMQSV